MAAPSSQEFSTSSSDLPSWSALRCLFTAELRDEPTFVQEVSSLLQRRVHNQISAQAKSKKLSLLSRGTTAGDAAKIFVEADGGQHFAQGAPGSGSGFPPAASATAPTAPISSPPEHQEVSDKARPTTYARFHAVLARLKNYREDGDVAQTSKDKTAGFTAAAAPDEATQSRQAQAPGVVGGVLAPAALERQFPFCEEAHKFWTAFEDTAAGETKDGGFDYLALPQNEVDVLFYTTQAEREEWLSSLESKSTRFAEAREIERNKNLADDPAPPGTNARSILAISEDETDEPRLRSSTNHSQRLLQQEIGKVVAAKKKLEEEKAIADSLENNADKDHVEKITVSALPLHTAFPPPARQDFFSVVMEAAARNRARTAAAAEKENDLDAAALNEAKGEADEGQDAKTTSDGNTEEEEREHVEALASDHPPAAGGVEVAEPRQDVVAACLHKEDEEERPSCAEEGGGSRFCGGAPGDVVELQNQVNKAGSKPDSCSLAVRDDEIVAATTESGSTKHQYQQRGAAVLTQKVQNRSVSFSSRSRFLQQLSSSRIGSPPGKRHGAYRFQRSCISTTRLRDRAMRAGRRSGPEGETTHNRDADPVNDPAAGLWATCRSSTDAANIIVGDETAAAATSVMMSAAERKKTFEAAAPWLRGNRIFDEHLELLRAAETPSAGSADALRNNYPQLSQAYENRAKAEVLHKIDFLLGRQCNGRGVRRPRTPRGTATHSAEDESEHFSVSMKSARSSSQSLCALVPQEARLQFEREFERSFRARALREHHILLPKGLLPKILQLSSTKNMAGNNVSASVSSMAGTLGRTCEGVKNASASRATNTDVVQLRDEGIMNCSSISPRDHDGKGTMSVRHPAGSSSSACDEDAHVKIAGQKNETASRIPSLADRIATLLDESPLLRQEPPRSHIASTSSKKAMVTAGPVARSGEQAKRKAPAQNQEQLASSGAASLSFGSQPFPPAKKAAPHHKSLNTQDYKQNYDDSGPPTSRSCCNYSSQEPTESLVVQQSQHDAVVVRSSLYSPTSSSSASNCSLSANSSSYTSTARTCRSQEGSTYDTRGPRGTRGERKSEDTVINAFMEAITSTGGGHAFDRQKRRHQHTARKIIRATDLFLRDDTGATAAWHQDLRARCTAPHKNHVPVHPPAHNSSGRRNTSSTATSTGREDAAPVVVLEPPPANNANNSSCADELGLHYQRQRVMRDVRQDVERLATLESRLLVDVKRMEEKLEEQKLEFERSEAKERKRQQHHRELRKKLDALYQERDEQLEAEAAYDEEIAAEEEKARERRKREEARKRQEQKVKIEAWRRDKDSAESGERTKKEQRAPAGDLCTKLRGNEILWDVQPPPPPRQKAWLLGGPEDAASKVQGTHCRKVNGKEKSQSSSARTADEPPGPSQRDVLRNEIRRHFNVKAQESSSASTSVSNERPAADRPAKGPAKEARTKNSNANAVNAAASVSGTPFNRSTRPNRAKLEMNLS
ncbi:unnamed protein product [Amoebophrya sp. A120]|nr:unnamed protein product [Amoebophrya sp. A120]|eukprot:GSA120T00004301001.1